MFNAGIKAIGVYLPERMVDNDEIEQMIRFNHSSFEKGVIGQVFGIKSRFFADKHTQVSDLACRAAEKILMGEKSDPDLLIFAAASSDMIEPATGNIIQHKLGLKCPVIDVKNACNSVVSAIHIATAFIRAGIHRNILITCGEKLSEVINFNPRDHDHLLRCFAGYSLGDAGAALIISKDEGSEIIYQKFGSWGEHWHVCTVEGGGSMALREMEKYYFEGSTWTMRNIFAEKGVEFIDHCFNESGWRKEEIDCLITHQVSGSTPAFIASNIGIPLEKFVNTFRKFGNTAAASIPLSMQDAIENGILRKGARTMILGLAAGISISVQFIIW